MAMTSFYCLLVKFGEGPHGLCCLLSARTLQTFLYRFLIKYS